MPLVRPLAHEYRAEPERRAKPIILSRLPGEAEPRRTSGGRAASQELGQVSIAVLALAIVALLDLLNHKQRSVHRNDTSID